MKDLFARLNGLTGPIVALAIVLAVLGAAVLLAGCAERPKEGQPGARVHAPAPFGGAAGDPRRDGTPGDPALTRVPLPVSPLKLLPF
jgi:hypothetical protein